MPQYCHMEKEFIHKGQKAKKHPKGVQKSHPSTKFEFKHCKDEVLIDHPTVPSCLECMPGPCRPKKKYECCNKSDGELGCQKFYKCCEELVNHEGCVAKYQCCGKDPGKVFD